MVDFLESKKEKTSKIRVRSQKRGYNLARKYTTILKIKINSTTTASLLNAINSKIENDDRFLIVTPNPEIIMLAQSDPLLASCLNSADMSLPDGVGLVWASRWSARETLFSKTLGALLRTIGKQSHAPRLDTLQTPDLSEIEKINSGSSALHFSKRFPSHPRAQEPNSLIAQRISGIDVMLGLMKIAEKRGWRVFLLGGRVGVAEAAAQNLISQYPNIPISYHSGPWLGENGEPVNKKEEQKEKEIIEKMNKFKPHLLFVGFGAPKQEKWASRCLRLLDANCVMVVGGAFDYISGRVPRAPKWVRDIGFEWLFRLIIEPWRIRRQLALIRFAWAVVTSM